MSTVEDQEQIQAVEAVWRKDAPPCGAIHTERGLYIAARYLLRQKGSNYETTMGSVGYILQSLYEKEGIQYKPDKIEMHRFFQQAKCSHFFQLRDHYIYQGKDLQKSKMVRLKIEELLATVKLCRKLILPIPARDRYLYYLSYTHFKYPKSKLPVQWQKYHEQLVIAVPVNAWLPLSWAAHLVALHLLHYYNPIQRKIDELREHDTESAESELRAQAHAQVDWKKAPECYASAIDLQQEVRDVQKRLKIQLENSGVLRVPDLLNTMQGAVFEIQQGRQCQAYVEQLREGELSAEEKKSIEKQLSMSTTVKLSWFCIKKQVQQYEQQRLELRRSSFNINQQYYYDTVNWIWPEDSDKVEVRFCNAVARHIIHHNKPVRIDLMGFYMHQMESTTGLSHRPGGSTNSMHSILEAKGGFFRIHEDLNMSNEKRIALNFDDLLDDFQVHLSRLSSLARPTPPSVPQPPPPVPSSTPYAPLNQNAKPLKSIQQIQNDPKIGLNFPQKELCYTPQQQQLWEAADLVFPMQDLSLQDIHLIDAKCCNAIAKTCIVNPGPVTGNELGNVIRGFEELYGVAFKPKSKTIQAVVDRSGGGIFILKDDPSTGSVSKDYILDEQQLLKRAELVKLGAPRCGINTEQRNAPVVGQANKQSASEEELTALSKVLRLQVPTSRDELSTDDDKQIWDMIYKMWPRDDTSVTSQCCSAVSRALLFNNNTSRMSDLGQYLSYMEKYQGQRLRVSSKPLNKTLERAGKNYFIFQDIIDQENNQPVKIVKLNKDYFLKLCNDQFSGTDRYRI